jgi:hypothetical protein
MKDGRRLGKLLGLGHVKRGRVGVEFRRRRSGDGASDDSPNCDFLKHLKRHRNGMTDLYTEAGLSVQVAA